MYHNKTKVDVIVIDKNDIDYTINANDYILDLNTISNDKIKKAIVKAVSQYDNEISDLFNNISYAVIHILNNQNVNQIVNANMKMIKDKVNEINQLADNYNAGR